MNRSKGMNNSDTGNSVTSKSNVSVMTKKVTGSDIVYKSTSNNKHPKIH